MSHRMKHYQIEDREGYIKEGRRAGELQAHKQPISCALIICCENIRISALFIRIFIFFILIFVYRIF